MPKTLVIDNDPRLQELFDHDETGGYCFARTAEQALEQLRDSAQIDIALVNIDDPQIGGMGLFRRLQGSHVRIPRIALTNGGDLDAIRRAMNEGAVDFLTKPVSLQDLHTSIDKVYRGCEERRKAWRTESELAAIRREIEIASDLQKRIVPDPLPNLPHLDIYAQTLPAKDIGGDFYDFFELGPHTLALLVADVCGKGVPAAFLMAITRTLIRATAVTCANPAECLSQVNSLLLQHHIPGRFVSVFYAVLDTRKWQLTYTNGGHLPPYLISGNGDRLQQLTGAHGVVMGVQDDFPYEQKMIKFAPGACLFAYTDGITEAFDAQRRQFSEQRLQNYLLKNYSLPAQELNLNILPELAKFTGHEPQSDDITSLAIKRAAPR